MVSKFDNDSSPVMTLALSGDLSVRELSEIADKTVKPILERRLADSITGVASKVDGGRTITVDLPSTGVATGDDR